MSIDLLDDLRNHFRGIAFLLVLLSFAIKSVNPLAQAAAALMLLLVIKDAFEGLLNYRTRFREFRQEWANDYGDSEVRNKEAQSKPKMIGAFIINSTLTGLGEFLFWLGLFGIVAQTGGAYLLVATGMILWFVSGALQGAYVKLV